MNFYHQKRSKLWCTESWNKSNNCYVFIINRQVMKNGQMYLKCFWKSRHLINHFWKFDTFLSGGSNFRPYWWYKIFYFFCWNHNFWIKIAYYYFHTKISHTQTMIFKNFSSLQNAEILTCLFFLQFSKIEKLRNS